MSFHGGLIQDLTTKCLLNTPISEPSREVFDRACRGATDDNSPQFQLRV
jgi:hypothetical protein